MLLGWLREGSGRRTEAEAGGGQKRSPCLWEELGEDAQLERGMRKGMTGTSMSKEEGRAGPEPQPGPSQERGVRCNLRDVAT